jgi:hypothetical protein
MISEILIWSERLIGFAILLQSIELIVARKSFSRDGIWNWEILREILLIQVLCSVLMMAAPEESWTALVLIFATFSALFVCWRFRGTYNGGSDFMTIVVLSGLTGAKIFPQWQKYFLAYIAVQVCLSYFISGFGKLKKKNWFSGEALRSLSKSRNYSIPALAREQMNRPNIARAASLSLIAFEISFPLALINQDFCRAYLAVAVIFHLMMFYVFGLNRFLWAWLSAYPALYCFSVRAQ